MNEQVKRDALHILETAISILKVSDDKDVYELKQLSDYSIHTASVFQDECSVSLATLMYALSKVIERKQHTLECSPIVTLMNKAYRAIKHDELANFHVAVETLFSEISKIDSKLALYVQHVVNQAQIKKACRLCEHGLSAAQASRVLGVSQWEVLNYVGKTKLNENNMDGVNVRTRLKNARKLFT